MLAVLSIMHRLMPGPRTSTDQFKQ